MKIEQYQNSVSVTRLVSLYPKQLRKFKSNKKDNNF